ncbi:MAG: alkaline phosphatase family protein [Promethearchaeota archaeon]|nr:MAG: alkaline phosphatase family protein [Candidatus Lokiarchaeota archaeon]
MSRSAKVNQVILVLIDDVRAEHLFNLMNKGKLPNISRITENGIMCSNCITSYPSITFPCYSNIITGTYSDYFLVQGSGIPQYHYVKRSDPPSIGKRFPKIVNCGEGSLLKLNKELGPNCKTIFEQAKDGNFFSALNIVSRGSLMVSAKPYTTERILKLVEDVFKEPKKFFENNEVPLITVAYTPYTDHLMHHKGFDHLDYTNEILKFEKGLGGIINTLKNTGYYDSTAIGIISDHGNYKAEKIFDLEPFFQQKGLITYTPRKGIGDFDCNFGSVGFFNFRGETWHHHPTIQQMQKFKPSVIGKQNLNLFDTLWEIPGVKYMYYRDNDNKPEKGVIQIEYKDKNIGRKIRGMIEYEGFGQEQKTRYTYDVNDFYGYSKDEESAKILDNRFHTIEEWLEATNRIDFPMIIDQIPRYFKNPRSCDIIVSTLGKFGFGYEHGKTVGNYPYLHDIALRESMIVPFIIGGSAEIPPMELKYCKTTDMVPTLLDLLGFKPHSSVVGKSILKYF